MNFKGTLFFRSSDRGWSENIWIDRTSHTLAISHLEAYRDARLKLLATDCHIVAERVSNVDSARDSLVKTFANNGGLGLAGLAGTEEDPEPTNLPDDALVVELFGGPALKNRIFLRGLPDSVIISGRYQPDTDFEANLSGVTDSLESVLQAVGYKVRNKVGADIVYSAILSINVKGVTTRKCGRPFGLRPGRRRSRPSA